SLPDTSAPNPSMESARYRHGTSSARQLTALRRRSPDVPARFDQPYRRCRYSGPGGQSPGNVCLSQPHTPKTLPLPQGRWATCPSPAGPARRYVRHGWRYRCVLLSARRHCWTCPAAYPAAGRRECRDHDDEDDSLVLLAVVRVHTTFFVMFHHVG